MGVNKSYTAALDAFCRNCKIQPLGNGGDLGITDISGEVVVPRVLTAKLVNITPITVISVWRLYLYIVFMGIIDQLITGGYHLVGTVIVSFCVMSCLHCTISYNHILVCLKMGVRCAPAMKR